ncbi:hypothetical protein CAQU_08135 [Corynebacterium aquilae DSM 44791]|uniref:Uncharacterized protein n=1 Tax=Corynebacterium aquilae DSM 44791 TaxID=1431546 RepID=A0A1L7CGS8_9CORY|nr:hypothetical protein CAQU_08135 [Corynebacterium aquilae DSM 44791]
MPEGVRLSHAIAVVALVGAVTLVLRAVPFVAAHALKHSQILSRASVVLPLGVMTVLAVDGAVGMEHPVLGVFAGVCTVLLQWWRRSMMLALVGGTGVYMAGVVALGVVGS